MLCECIASCLKWRHWTLLLLLMLLLYMKPLRSLYCLVCFLFHATDYLVIKNKPYANEQVWCDHAVFLFTVCHFESCLFTIFGLVKLCWNSVLSCIAKFRNHYILKSTIYRRVCVCACACVKRDCETQSNNLWRHIQIDPTIWISF